MKKSARLLFVIKVVFLVAHTIPLSMEVALWTVLIRRMSIPNFLEEVDLILPREQRDAERMDRGIPPPLFPARGSVTARKG